MDCNYRCLPLRDVRLRQAISKAIDRDALIRQHLAGQASPASGPYPSGHSFVPHDAVPLGFDPDEARRLLGEMGYQAASQGYATTATGQHIRLRLMVLPTAVGDRAVQVCEGIKGYLEDVGIEVTLASVTRAQFYEALESGQGYDLLYTQSVVPMNSSLMGRYAGESDLPSGVLSAVRVLIGNRESTGDLDAVRMAENEFHRQMAGLSPSIYLWDPNGVAAFTMDLHNVDIHPFYFFSYVLNWYRQRFE
jgi:ABC-type transport system substrate-binding protein